MHGERFKNMIFSKEDGLFMKILKIIGMVIVGIIFAVLIAFLFSYIVRALWNWLMPELFGLKTITYWQAFGIVILSKILFNNIGHGDKGSHGKHRKRHICEPHDSKHYDDFWKAEGKAAFEAYVERAESEKTDKQQP